MILCWFYVWSCELSNFGRSGGYNLELMIDMILCWLYVWSRELSNFGRSGGYNLELVKHSCCGTELELVLASHHYDEDDNYLDQENDDLDVCVFGALCHCIFLIGKWPPTPPPGKFPENSSLWGMQGFLYNDDNDNYVEVGVEGDNGYDNTTDRRGIWVGISCWCSKLLSNPISKLILYTWTCMYL